MSELTSSTAFTGLPAAPEMPWGAHLCQFYRTRDDLADTLVPYFEKGLAHNERCLWITSEPFQATEARAAMRRVVPHLDALAEKGQIEIVDHAQWYARALADGPDAVLDGWMTREQEALRDGYAGLRVSGNVFPLERKDWGAFADFEKKLHQAFHERRIIALCSYSLGSCSPDDLVDVLRNHKFALVRRASGWEAIQSATMMLSVGTPLPEAAPLVASSGATNHIVQFFQGDAYAADPIAEYLAEGLRKGEAAVAVATAPHLEAITAALARQGVDTGARLAEGALVCLEARALLARFMGDALPNEKPCREEILGVLGPLEARGRPIRVYGEMVDVLVRDGKPDAAYRLEQIWNGLLTRGSFTLLCGYALDGFHGEARDHVFEQVCSSHGEVAPAVGATGTATTTDHNRVLAELQLKNGALQSEIVRRQDIERDRTRFFGQAQAAAQRLAVLQRVTSALSEAVSPQDVANVVVTDMMRALEATQAALVVPVSEGADTLRVLGSAGVDAATLEEYVTFSVEAPVPVAAAFRTGAPILLRSRAAIRSRYPALGAEAQAIVALPLAVSGRRLGALGFGYANEREVSASDRAFMDDLARQAGLALERARLYEEARVASDALREANRRKDEFLAILGHELRNPLAPIMTALQLMKLRGNAGSEKERAAIERQVLHVSRLVDDLLDVSRVTQGKLEMRKERVELSAVMARAIELASPLIEERSHRLIVDVPKQGLVVCVDQVRFAQALANLLNNAAKYTDRGGQISVHCVRDQETVTLTVTDTGMGIRSEMLPLIFEPFVQVQRTLERAQGGLGLGLALVRSLVQLHGGETRAESDGPGRGSRFSVTIPVAASQRPVATRAATPALPKADAKSGQRVLVVDDNSDAADFLAEMLRLLGHQVLVAYDGAEALEKAEGFTFDVAILDISLPVIDGYELARRLRERRPGKPVRLVALTGFGTEEDVARAESAGFEAHFVKPVDHARLMELLSVPPSRAH